MQFPEIFLARWEIVMKAINIFNRAKSLESNRIYILFQSMQIPKQEAPELYLQSQSHNHNIF